MQDLGEIVKQAVEGTFPDDIILALKEAMKDAISAGKVADIDSRIAELFWPRRNNQILNIDYRGEQLFSTASHLSVIKSSNPEIFTSGRGVTTYSEILDYALVSTRRKSSKRRKARIIEALKKIVGNNTVDSYIKSRSDH